MVTQQFDEIEHSAHFSRYATEQGSFYFSDATLAFFNTRFHGGLCRAGDTFYMIISDKNWEPRRVYSVVCLTRDGHVEKHEDAKHLSTLKKAEEALAKIIADAATTLSQV